MASQKLEESFNGKYGDNSMWITGDHARTRSPKDPSRRGKSGEVMSPREQLIYQIEELLEVETDVWDKKRATIKNEDLKTIYNGLLEKLDVEPAQLQENMDSGEEH